MSWVPPPPVVVGSVAVGTAAYPVPTSGVLYVAPGGNDASAGTMAAPKRTLGAAISAAPSGSSIVLRAGEYHETVTVPSTKGLTIQAYPGEAVWFDGSARYLAWSGSGPWTSPLGVSWSPISSSRYLQAGDGLAHLPEQVWIDDVAQTQVADEATPGAGQFSVNRTTRTISIGTDPAGRDVRVAELRRWMLATGPITLRGFGVRRYSPAAVEGPDSALMYVAGSSYNSLVENVVFRQSGIHGLAIIRPITLNRVTVEDCNLAGIQVTTANNSLISRFIIRNCNLGGWHPQPITAGIKITRTDGLVLRDGIVENVPGSCGVWFDVSNTRFIVANVTARNVATGFEAELSGGGKYDVVQHHSWFVNCRTANIDDWSMQILDSDHVTVANCDLAPGRVSINLQQDRPGNTGTSGNLTFEIVPWVCKHNRILNNRVLGQPAFASMIAYHDPPEPVRDPDGGPDTILLGWDCLDQVVGNWVPNAPPGSMIQLGKVDGFRTSYNTWGLVASSGSTVGGPPGAKLGTNHSGATAPSDTIAVPLPDDIANLLGIPRGHQRVGTILHEPVTTQEQEEEEVTPRQWLLDNTDGVTCTTGNVLAKDGTAASIVNAGTGGTLTFESDRAHAGPTGVKFTPGTGTNQIRLPFVAASATGAVSFYHSAASLPPGTRDIFNLRHSSGQILRLATDPQGRLLSRTGGGAAIAQSATDVWAVSRHNRIELVFNVGGTGATDSYTATIYDDDSLTPLATLTSNAVDLGTADAVSIDIGHPNNTSSGWETFYDSIQMDNGATSGIGPYVPDRNTPWTLEVSAPRRTLAIATPGRELTVITPGRTLEVDA